MTPDEEILDSPVGWVAQHIRGYVESDDAKGHRWRGVHTLLLTTRGRRSGKLRRTALIYGRDGDRYVVVASQGGAPKHPLWYLNLVANPEVQVQVGSEKFTANARTAGPGRETRPLDPDDLNLARLRQLPGADRAGHPGHRAGANRQINTKTRRARRTRRLSDLKVQ